MEPFIVNSTPKGSALLAYGSARGPGWNFKLPALVAGSLALVGIVVSLIWILVAKTMLPTERLITVVTQPHAIHARLDPALRRDLPSSWRAAIETNSRLPALFGVTLGEDQQLHAFALVARTARIAAEPTFTVTKAGAFHLLTDDGAHEERESLRVARAFRGAWSLRSNDAAFTIDAARLRVLTNDTIEAAQASTPDELRGTWKERAGTLSLAPEQTAAQTAVMGPIFAILGDNQEDARPAVTGLLSQGIDLRGVAELPTSIAVDPEGNGSIELSWPALPTGETAGRLVALQGNPTKKPLFLPDHAQVTEIQPGTPATNTQKGATMLFLGDGLASTTLDYAQKESVNSACPGIIRFSLHSGALQRVLAALSLPESWRSAFNRFFITESADSVHICVE
jgi:hypothetical protein